MSRMNTTEWWLVRIPDAGPIDFVDGSHEDRDGVEQALYLHTALGFNRGGHYACVEMHITPIEAKAHDVNHEAVATLNSIGLKP